MSGTIIGAPQTYEYFKMIQDRIIDFIQNHSLAQGEDIERMMLHTGILTKDLGTILVGKQAVEAGIVNDVGGVCQAVAKLEELCFQKHSV